MKFENTICHKIDTCFEDLEAIMTNKKDINLQAFVLRLHAIRDDATKMDLALEARKRIMTAASLEDDYQKNKYDPVEKFKNSDGIDKIGSVDKITYDNFTYEFTIKDLDKNEILFQQPAHAAVVSIVTSMEGVDKDGVIHGEAYKFSIGHPMAVWFAFDQLRQTIEAKVTNTRMLLTALFHKGFDSPEVAKKLKEIFKLSVIKHG